MKKQRKSLGSFFKNQIPSADALPLTERQKVQSELERYLMSPDADSGSEPLEWWRLHESNFPRYNEKCQYLWRLSRAYADAHDFAADLAEKKSCAATVYNCTDRFR
ncbi:putative zinc finger BED domain-containing protein 1-like [Triplophysa rosa]|uniref:Zinc finger BED domain-containing protein 1-like n=1 Tax=Triplophysa rosa TaxID=992332 RepID=A0A9W7WP33_TRIRA|nr:putative zinc finger BED domain-containing protein 1-like [Triplophysa rosa]